MFNKVTQVNDNLLNDNVTGTSTKHNKLYFTLGVNVDNTIDGTSHNFGIYHLNYGLLICRFLVKYSSQQRY